MDGGRAWMNRNADKTPGLIQRMGFDIQPLHVLDLQHGIPAAIQPRAVFNRGKIRIGRRLLREPIEVECESVGLYWLHAEWCHERHQQVWFALNVCGPQGQQTGVRPAPQQSFVHGLTGAITLKPVFNQLDGKTFWVGYVGEIAHITELVRL